MISTVAFSATVQMESGDEMDKRNKELLKALATAFEEGRSMDGYFLQENNVTADECIALTNMVAAILRSYIYAPGRLQLTMLASGVNEREQIGEMIWFNGIRDYAMTEARKSLDRLGK